MTEDEATRLARALTFNRPEWWAIQAMSEDRAPLAVGDEVDDGTLVTGWADWGQGVEDRRLSVTHDATQWTLHVDTDVEFPAGGRTATITIPAGRYRAEYVAGRTILRQANDAPTAAPASPNRPRSV